MVKSLGAKERLEAIDKQVRAAMEKERAVWKNENKPSSPTQARKKNKRQKKSYPLLISYFEPYEIAIFVLVSREI